MPSIRKAWVSRRRRFLAVLSTVALTVAASVGLLLTSTAAHAAGGCGSPPQAGWRLAAQPQRYGGVELQVWQRATAPFPMVVRFANLQANGKTGVSGEVGYKNQQNTLGTTGSIGTAPNGGWCSNVNTANVISIWGALGFDAGGKHHYENVTCNNYNSETSCWYSGIG